MRYPQESEPDVVVSGQVSALSPVILRKHPSLPKPWPSGVQPLPITVHVYDVSRIVLLNKVLKPMGSGAFHVGLEVLGKEWSYTGAGGGTGVFQCRPQKCPGHVYRDSVSMGQAFTSEEELGNMIKLLEDEWQSSGYDTLTKNCCHFVDDFSQRLGVGSIPAWLTHLAGVGRVAKDAADTTCCRTLHSQVRAAVCCDSACGRAAAAGMQGMPLGLLLAGEPADLKRHRRRSSDGHRWIITDSPDEVASRPHRQHECTYAVTAPEGEVRSDVAEQAAEQVCRQ